MIYSKIRENASVFIVLILALSMMMSCDSDTSSNNSIIETQERTFDYDGLTRDYSFYRPQDLSQDAPLLFVLHSYGGSARLIRNYTAFNALADEYGFAVCYPQGILDSQGVPFWNVGYDFHQDQSVDDAGFLAALATSLQNEFNLNPEFTFSTGMSNGGDMCYMLACQESDTFKAVATVAGSLMQWIYNDCSANVVPVFEIHGDNDMITLWEGDLDNSDGWGSYLPVIDTFNFWVQQNQATTSKVVELQDLVSSDNSTVTSTIYSGGINNNEVWLYRVNNGGHDWPGSEGNMDINASDEIWSFFETYIVNNQ